MYRSVLWYVSDVSLCSVVHLLWYIFDVSLQDVSPIECIATDISHFRDTMPLVMGMDFVDGLHLYSGSHAAGIT